MDRTYQIDTRELIKALGMFEGMATKAGQKAQVRFTLALLRAEILASPVKTGTLRSGWVASVSKPSSFVPVQLKRTKGDRKGRMGAEGQAHYDEAKRELEQIVGKQRIGTRTYVSNNVRYVDHVNNSGPHAGFIEAAAENALAQFGVEIDLS